MMQYPKVPNCNRHAIPQNASSQPQYVAIDPTLTWQYPPNLKETPERASVAVVKAMVINRAAAFAAI